MTRRVQVRLAKCREGQRSSIAIVAGVVASAIAPACAPGNENGSSTEPPAGASASTANVEASSTAPVTTGAPTTAATTAAATRATTPPSTLAPSTAPSSTSVQENRRVGLWQAGVARAEELSDALVAADWASVRQINPSTPYTDEQLADGYAGLVDQELVLAGRRGVDSDSIVLYFMLLADEERPAPQTSTYCVRWDYDGATNTIVQHLGVFIDRTDGFSRDAVGAAWMCADMEAGSMIEPPSRADGSLLIGDEIDDPGVIRYGSGLYECVPPPRLLGVARECRTQGAASNAQPAVLCSTSGEAGAYWDCTDEGFYPFELDGYDVARINGERALCTQETGDCWIWDQDESPREAVFFDRDYRCIEELCEPA